MILLTSGESSRAINNAYIACAAFDDRKTDAGGRLMRPLTAIIRASLEIGKFRQMSLFPRGFFE
jgi:hypothetical protein